MGIDVAFIARDRFSTAPAAMKALCRELPANSTVYVGDAGYPAEILHSVTQVCAQRKIDCRILSVGLYSTTNHAWNEIFPRTSEEVVLYVENDVGVSPACIDALAGAIRQDAGDIAVAAIFEADRETVHFRPVVSQLRSLSGGGYRVVLDRGRDGPDRPHVKDGASATAWSPVDIFERHCFLITRSSGQLLGDLDELMFCRTDLDLSLACAQAKLRTVLVSGATASLIPDLSAAEDSAFFGYRWDLHRATRANERLISKWGLVGYKTTIAHAEQAQTRLSELSRGE